MKLSVWSAYYIDLSPEDSLRELQKHGYKYCELSDEHALELIERGDEKQIGKEFGEFARELGIDILQGHLFLRANICDENDRKLIKRQLDLFHAIGIKYAVLHLDAFYRLPESPSLEFKREQNLIALMDISEHIKDMDMTICIENICKGHFIHTAEDILYFIDRLGTEHFGICLDTGHLNLTSDKDQVKFIEAAGKNIKALHIDDNDGNEIDRHLMPYGGGNIDIVAVLKAIKKLDYKGLYNLEIPGERNAPMEIRGYKLDYIQKMFAYLDSITD